MIVEGRPVPDWLVVSRETLEALERFQTLLLKWNRAVNLISKGSEASLWSRHILDSAQLSLFEKKVGSHWVDIGSGGGFPALVLAVISREKAPLRRFTLVESDVRKAAFLTAAARELDIKVDVLPLRAEEIAPLNADVISARALAPLDRLLNQCARHLSPSGSGFFPKGANFAAEIHAARERWIFNTTVHPSLTEPGAAVLEVTEIGIR